MLLLLLVKLMLIKIHLIWLIKLDLALVVQGLKVGSVDAYQTTVRKQKQRLYKIKQQALKWPVKIQLQIQPPQQQPPQQQLHQLYQMQQEFQETVYQAEAHNV